MTLNNIEEIYKHAKCLVLPYVGTSPLHSLHNHMEFAKLHEYIKLNRYGDNDTYTLLQHNDHHFTTTYHYKYVLPAVRELLKIPYSEYDFYLVKNIKEQGDFSYMLPKQHTEFNVITYSATISQNPDTNAYEYIIAHKEEHANFNEIVSVSICDEDSSMPVDNYRRQLDNNYHKLYKYSHKCEVLENLGENNGKTILISHDSQMIPIIPIIAKYYKKIISLDNRFSYSMIDFLNIKDEHIDDVLFELWEGNSLTIMDKNFA